jgi:hypothetical protein
VQIASSLVLKGNVKIKFGASDGVSTQTDSAGIPKLLNVFMQTWVGAQLGEQFGSSAEDGTRPNNCEPRIGDDEQPTNNTREMRSSDLALGMDYRTIC